MEECGPEQRRALLGTARTVTEVCGLDDLLLATLRPNGAKLAEGLNTELDDIREHRVLPPRWGWGRCLSRRRAANALKRANAGDTARGPLRRYGAALALGLEGLLNGP